jgi:CBS-domain-containing membrane protein
MLIEHLMNRFVHACDLNDSANHAAQLMWEHDCGCVPVLDPDRRVVGIVTDRDIAMAAYTQGKRLAEIPVVEIMSRDVHSCSEGDTILVAEGLMRMHQVRRLPVLDSDGYLTGMITLNDLASEAERIRDVRKPRIRLDEVAETLAKIGRHRGATTLVAAE